ncbi:MAG: hypothetical protein JG766_926 [Desulfacinum sp.]|jgi:hypothetical protein|nr:hypothetical protein [Desulfacinum sp.]
MPFFTMKVSITRPAGAQWSKLPVTADRVPLDGGIALARTGRLCYTAREVGLCHPHGKGASP